MILIFLAVLLVCSVFALVNVILGMLVLYGILSALIALGLISVINGILSGSLWLFIHWLKKQDLFDTGSDTAQPSLIRMIQHGLFGIALGCTSLCLLSFTGLCFNLFL